MSAATVKNPLSPFPAKYRGRCRPCGRPIAKGDWAVKVGEKAVWHKRCAKAAGYPIVGEDDAPTPDLDELLEVEADDQEALSLFQEFGPITVGSHKARIVQGDGGRLSIVAADANGDEVRIDNVLPSEFRRLRELIGEVLGE